MNVDVLEMRMISIPTYRFTTGAIHDAIGGSHVVISDSWHFISGFLDFISDSRHFISDWHFGASDAPWKAPSRNGNQPLVLPESHTLFNLTQ
ncbi:hypothetical protein [Lysinibacillus sp. NPDC056185]|uniref:hypothetical protein n=1 Tax=Lysinibacillus sp. NPDC056185 TaxID=3345739 RepID=UPI0039EF2575